MKNLRRNTISALQGILVVVIFLGLLTLTPAYRKAKKSVAKVRATSGCKEIGSAMLGFLDEYGGYPSQQTLLKLQAEGVKVLPIGNDANSYLGQLIAAGSVDSEKIFYVRGMAGMHEGNNLFDTPEELLKKGENGLGYVMLQGEKPLLKPTSIVPVVVAPLLAGGSDPIFDPEPFTGQYIYLTPDGAVSGGKIDKDGRPIAKGRGPGGLFGPGENSVFKDQGIPDVKMPR